MFPKLGRLGLVYLRFCGFDGITGTASLTCIAKTSSLGIRSNGPTKLSLRLQGLSVIFQASSNLLQQKAGWIVWNAMLPQGKDDSFGFTIRVFGRHKIHSRNRDSSKSFRFKLFVDESLHLLHDYCAGAIHWALHEKGERADESAQCQIEISVDFRVSRIARSVGKAQCITRAQSIGKTLELCDLALLECDDCVVNIRSLTAQFKNAVEFRANSVWRRLVRLTHGSCQIVIPLRAFCPVAHQRENSTPRVWDDKFLAKLNHRDYH
jgi:hypothetical protein